jgi:TPP-dependent pyruvate/acetoin dehydrogenase alpha subunit
LGGRLKNNGSVVFCFFGEGASNQGSFHEALNLASVQRLPVIFICENNLWALSRFADTTAGGSVANRANSYGIPGKNVDGNDAGGGGNSRAAAHARQGLGPSLLSLPLTGGRPFDFTKRKYVLKLNSAGRARPHPPVATALEARGVRRDT